MKSVRSVFLVVVLLSLVCGCVTREALTLPPSINVSAESARYATVSDAETAPDVGLHLAANESDSLDNIETLPGVRVRSVGANSAGSNAGIRVGDVILAVNGVATNHIDTFTRLLQSAEVVQFVLEIRRDTTVYEVTLAKPAQGSTARVETLYQVEPLKLRAGFVTEQIVDGDGNTITAAKLTKVFAKSPLLSSAVAVGDAVVTVDGQPVESAQGLVNALARDYDFGATIKFGIYSERNGLRDATVTLWEPEQQVTGMKLWPLFSYSNKAQQNTAASARPEVVHFTLLDLWVISLFEYERNGVEKRYSFFKFLEFSSGYGELEETAVATP